MHTRALSHAFLMPSSPMAPRTMGQGTQGADAQQAPEPPARTLGPESAAALGALKEAHRLYAAVKAGRQDLATLIGNLKTDEAIGQAAANLENAKGAYQDAMARGA